MPYRIAVIDVDTGKERSNSPYESTELPLDPNERAIAAVSYLLTMIDELRSFANGLLDDRIQQVGPQQGTSDKEEAAATT